MIHATAIGILTPLSLIVIGDALREYGWAAAIALGTSGLAIVWWRLSRAIEAVKGDQL